MASSFDDQASLRRLAEQRLSQAGPASDLSNVELAELIHELKVHQIELEMQNEELKHSRDELELARDHYAQLYNHAPLGYLTLDQHGVILKANKTFTDMVGLSLAAVTGKPLATFLHPDDEAQFLGRFSPIFRQPEAKQVEVRLRTDRQTGIMVRLHARRGFDQNSLLLALVDITQQKDAESKIKGLLNEKQILLREVHHRIKNNMNVISAFLSLQALGCSQPEAVSALEEAQGRIRSMMLIYDKLYRSEDFLHVSAKEYLEELLEEIAGQFSSNRVCVEAEIEDVMLDSSVLFPLGIIINELLTNAFKYAFPDHRAGCVKVSISRRADRQLVCQVCDSGIGLPVKESESGAGFGLTLVQALVEQLGGTLTSDSRKSSGPRHGSCFTISFMLK